MNENIITDGCSSHKYFTQTTNIIFHLGLSAYEIALYMTLKRTAGAGALSKKGTKRLALESGMSPPKVSVTKKELEKPRKELGGKSLITIKKTVNESGGNGVDHIYITDLEQNSMEKKKEKD